MDNFKEEAKIRKYVKEGCTISPSILIVYIQEAINNIK